MFNKIPELKETKLLTSQIHVKCFKCKKHCRVDEYIYVSAIMNCPICFNPLSVCEDPFGFFFGAISELGVDTAGAL